MGRPTLRRIQHAGTEHDVHRLGDDLVVRLPVMAGATDQAELERRWLPALGPTSRWPCRSAGRAAGWPAHGYPFAWSVWDWLPSRSVDSCLGDPDAAALAAFVADLHADPPTSPRRAGRTAGAAHWPSGTRRCGER